MGVAFDHVIESFRNELFGGYKTGAGIDPDLWSQAPLAERAARALGLVVWPMVDFEADDAMAAAAARYGAIEEVEQVPGDAGQGLESVCPRRSGRALGPPAAAGHRRGRGHREVGCTPVVDPGLPGPRRRRRGRHPRAPRMGRSLGGDGPRPLRPPGGDPGRSRRLGRQGARCGAPGREPARSARRRCSTAGLRRCARTCRSARSSTTEAGAGPTGRR